MIARLAIWLGVVALSVAAYFSGNAVFRAALPILIASLVAWLFARTLRRGRTPLIARAIAALDGPHWLSDPAVARHARRLTCVWAVYLALLALIVAALALLDASTVARWQRLPTAQHFGAIGIPVAVAALLLGEFVTRHWWLPQAPRHGLVEFLRKLIVAWPRLLDDRVSKQVQAAPAEVRESFSIATTHPALPGHFPGDPIVPGVILLEHAASAAARAWNVRIAGIVQAKFLQPLRAQEQAVLTLRHECARVQWRIVRGTQPIASGILELGT